MVKFGDRNIVNILVIFYVNICYINIYLVILIGVLVFVCGYCICILKI